MARLSGCKVKKKRKREIDSKRARKKMEGGKAKAGKTRLGKRHAKGAARRPEL